MLNVFLKYIVLALNIKEHLMVVENVNKIKLPKSNMILLNCLKNIL